jgi:UDP-glucose 4-epimerase
MSSAAPPCARRALVTGAAGFIGGPLCKRLTRDGYEVHGVSRQARTDGDLQWWQVDLADVAETRRLVDSVRPAVLFHLAGLPSGARALDLVLPTLQNNLVAAVNVMLAATECGTARTVISGSLEEAEPREGHVIPNSPYAVSKHAASAYARMFHAIHGLPVVVARISMVYGPGQADSAKLIPYLIGSLLRGETPSLGGGDRCVDWVYVDDVVDALVTFAETAALEGETLDVGSGRVETIRSLTDQILAILGSDIRPAFGELPEREQETELIAGTARTREITGWQARMPLEDGLRTTIQWHRRRLR